MPSGSWRRSLTVAALIIASLLLGCGVPGEPLPPLLEIPAPIQDLAAEQVGAQVRLVWSRPRLTTEGTRVRRPARMEIYGTFSQDETALASFPEQSRLLATVWAQDLPESQEQVTYELSLDSSRVKHKAIFAVKAINHNGKDAGYSNVVSLAIANLPEMPSDLQATLTEKAIVLNWKPGLRSAFGGPAPEPDGYQVYRAEAPSPETSEVVGTTKSPPYSDDSFQFGHRYVYSVRAFVKRGNSLATTPHSASTTVVAADRFPPAPPQNVRGIAVPGAVEITWSPNSEPDLAGYNVYRSEGSAFQKRNPELLPAPLFRDASVRPGARYLYQIKAVDQAGNESAPSEEVSVEAE